MRHTRPRQRRASSARSSASRCHSTADAPHATRSEQFRADCFDASIARGGQVIRIDHWGDAIPGVLTCFTDNKLSFRLRVFDSALGRSALDLARAGQFRGASIVFNGRTARESYKSNVIHVHEATLIEIALCRHTKPAWYDTFVGVEA
jgi:phage head maturation protease